MVGTGHRDNILPRRARRLGTSRLLAAWAAATLLASLVVVVASPISQAGGPTATFTATNVNASTGNGTCIHPDGSTPAAHDPVNCNLYNVKVDVWLNGGPDNAALDPGTYYFNVTDPSGKVLLSSDAVSDRTFNVIEFPAGSGDFIIDPAAHGTHDLEHGELQLVPFADTPNNGGVYKLAICNVATGHCKNDSFKVQGGSTPPATVNSVFNGNKWNDANHNGVLDPTESGLQDWTIDITPTGGSTVTTTTDSSGNWTFTTPAVTPSTGTTTYTICEEQQAHWAQTGPIQADVDTANGTATGGASVSLDASLTPPSGNCYSVDVPNDAVATVGSLDFFNVPTVTSSFSGHKYLDLNGNGTFDTGEPGLTGWTIDITPTGGATVTQTTGTGGAWSYTTPEVAPKSGTTDYTICETANQKPHWAQTGPVAADLTTANGTATGGSSAVLSGKCYVVTVPNDATNSMGSLDFFNQPTGVISGAKYYDGNKNGQNDSEPAVNGWKIVIKTSPGGTVVQTLTTASGGVFTSNDLAPGTYTVSEVAATNGWTETGNTVNQSSTSGGANVSLLSFTYTVTIPNDQLSTASNLYFGNVCTVRPGGLTLGFWSNKNGQALETQNDFTSTTSGLNALNLRNANGTDKDFTDTLANNKKALNTWLLSASATNMAYMLSAQLAAVQLNVNHGITNQNIVVDGTRTVAQEIVYANSLLANPIAAGTFVGQNGSVTVAASALRTEQDRVKTIIDSINNNGGFVQPGPGTCPAPTFP